MTTVIRTIFLGLVISVSITFLYLYLPSSLLSPLQGKFFRHTQYLRPNGKLTPFHPFPIPISFSFYKPDNDNNNNERHVLTYYYCVFRGVDIREWVKIYPLRHCVLCFPTKFLLVFCLDRFRIYLSLAPNNAHQSYSSPGKRFVDFKPKDKPFAVVVGNLPPWESAFVP